MQTTKSRPGSLNVPQKTSPTKPHTARKLKSRGSDSDSLSSPSPVRKTPNNRSPNVVDNRRSSISPASEKKKPSIVSELESQLAHLQDELKKAKDQLSSSEASKKKAEHEADEAKIQLAAISAELHETRKQLNELSDSEDARIQELRKISQDRDKEWQSELEAVRKQHDMDSAALASALNEIQRLKFQLEQLFESEAAQFRRAESAQAEIHILTLKLKENLELVEKLKRELSDSSESETRALEEVSKAKTSLEVVKTTEEKLKSENGNVIESYESLLVELENSKNRVNSLEGLVSKLQADFANIDKRECDQSENLKTEINNLKNEASRLRDALEDAEKTYQDRYLEMTVQIRDANELVNRSKMESFQREAELETKLKESRAEIEELKMTLIKKENASCERETELEIELKNSESILEDLKASLSEKEMQLQSIADENEALKSEISKKETEKSKASNEAVMKLGYLTEEADKSSRKAERLTEQLDAAQAANSEMEAELRRLKVQSDQWRKAAEAATAMLSTGTNGKYFEKPGSLDYQTIGGKLGSPFSDDESHVKKNGNVLKKIGVLLKKGQK